MVIVSTQPPSPPPPTSMAPFKMFISSLSLLLFLLFLFTVISSAINRMETLTGWTDDWRTDRPRIGWVGGWWVSGRYPVVARQQIICTDMINTLCPRLPRASPSSPFSLNKMQLRYVRTPIRKAKVVMWAKKKKNNKKPWQRRGHNLETLASFLMCIYIFILFYILQS